MKNYQHFLSLGKDGRVADLTESLNLADHMGDAKTGLQKHLGKLLSAMTTCGEITSGGLAKQAKKLTGKDIRKDLQDVYALVNIFDAIVADQIDLSEEDYDSMDSSKLALLATFLGDKHKDKLPQAIEAAKTGTAKAMRDLKPKEPSKDKARIKELEAAAAERETAARGTPITFGFIATDIGLTDPLVDSKQWKTRLREDFIRAVESENDTALETMVNLFGKAFTTACEAFGCDPLDFLADLASETARPAAGNVVEIAGALENVA